jgi:hypothetical protein
MSEQEKTFSVTTTIESQRIADLVTTAFEGGSNYWIETVSILKVPPKPEGEDHSYPWYSFKNVYEDPDFQVKINVEDDDPVIFDHASIQRGLDYLSKNYPRHINDILQENDDAETADAFLQACLFGDIVYG